VCPRGGSSVGGHYKDFNIVLFERRLQQRREMREDPELPLDPGKKGDVLLPHTEGREFLQNMISREESRGRKRVC